VFGNLDAPGMPAFAGDGPGAQAVSEAMMDAWLAFARGESPWPSYDRSRRATFDFGHVREVRDAPFDDERALLERLVSRRAD
jgi:para-nitrobenzyl esterase